MSFTIFATRKSESIVSFLTTRQPFFLALFLQGLMQILGQPKLFQTYFERVLTEVDSCELRLLSFSVLNNSKIK